MTLVNLFWYSLLTLTLRKRPESWGTGRLPHKKSLMDESAVDSPPPINWRRPLMKLARKFQLCSARALQKRWGEMKWRVSWAHILRLQSLSNQFKAMWSAGSSRLMEQLALATLETVSGESKNFDRYVSNWGPSRAKVLLITESPCHTANSAELCWL